MYIFIDIYRVYSFCTTLPIVWQSLCDLGSCKAMILVKFIGLSCLLLFFLNIFSLCVFFFLSDIICFIWRWEKGAGSDPAVGMPRTGGLGLTFFQSRQSVSVLPSPAVAPVWEYWRKNIRYCKSRETERESGGGGEGTSSPWTCNIRWTRDEQTARLVARLSPEQMDNDDEEMRWSPCPCPREIDGVD